MTPEGKISKEIRDALKALGYLAVRVQSGVVKVRGGYMHLAPEGTADVFVVLRPAGRLMGIEVKQPGEKATPVQLAWGADLVARGGLYVVVDNRDDAIAAVQAAS